MIVKGSYLARIFNKQDFHLVVSKVVFCPGPEKIGLLVPKKSEPFYIYFDEVLEKWLKFELSKREVTPVNNISKHRQKYKEIVSKVNFKIISPPLTRVVVDRKKSIIDDPTWKKMFQLWNSTWGIMSDDGLPGFLDAPIL